MNQLTKYFVYFIIFVKVLFLIALLREKFINNDKENENIKERVEIFHETFVFLMFILLVIVFHPMNNNILLDNDPQLSKHIQLIIFILGVIQLVNFDYVKILNAPIELVNSF